MTPPVYLAANPVEAAIVKDYLAAHGIETTIRGRHAWGAVGDIPIAEAYPRLYLEQEQDRERARRLIREYEARPDSGNRPCPKCGEPVPGHFAVCWNCSAPMG